jgi:hypothetical protein
MPLTLPEITRFAENSAAVRLLRGDEFINDLAFFYHAFRSPGLITIPESELKTALARWLDANYGDDGEGHPGWRPADRIGYYVKQEFLRKREPADQSEAVYELTSDIDRLLVWLEDQRRREFVGTEYGLQAIVRDLRELAARATGDWQKRLDALQARRIEIDTEIDAIYKDPTAKSGDTRYTLETLQRLERASQDLIGDFGLLRERFAELARDIARQHGTVSTRRGDVLRLALDGEDALRKTPMGESFYGFWRLVASSEREEFVDMVDAIYAVPGLPEDLRERRLLQSLLDRLRDQGQVVLDANRQLTRQLRRALDREEIETRRLMASRMGDLRLLLLGHLTELDGIAGIAVDERVELCLPMDRPVFDPPEPVIIDTAFKASAVVDLRAAAEQIAQAGLINFKRLLETIQLSLNAPRRSTGVLLSSVIEEHPPREGLLDLLGYLHIAKLLGDDAEVMVRQPFHWKNDAGREIVCPDVFFISINQLL